jgi:PTH1 family peptidyl-tRNA hydrolase
LRDVIAQLGHARFHRLRLGIGHPGHKDQVTNWVLGRPSKADEAAIRSAIDDALAVIELAVAGQFNEAMKRLHTHKERD